MNILEIGLSISIVINLVFLIGIRNLLKQNEQLEDKLIDKISEVRLRVESALNNMKSIDTKQAFEKDDEVGVTFQELKKLVEDLNNNI